VDPRAPLDDSNFVEEEDLNDPLVRYMHELAEEGFTEGDPGTERMKADVEAMVNRIPRKYRTKEEIKLARIAEAERKALEQQDEEYPAEAPSTFKRSHHKKKVV
jgi:hypothetical protein